MVSRLNNFPPPFRRPTWTSLRRKLDRCQRSLQKLQEVNIDPARQRKLLDQLDEDYDSVLNDLKLLCPQIWKDLDRLRRRPDRMVRVLKHLALPSTSKLVVHRIFSDDGKESLERIEVFLGSHHFSLPPKLGALLEIIAGGKPETPGGIVPWKSCESVAQDLGSRFGRDKPISVQALRELIRRLRRRLWENRINPYLVQTDRICGVRFALKPMDLG